MKLKISRLQHVGIPVTNIGISKQFYEGFGFEDVMSTGFTMHGDAGNVTMMKQGDIILELYQLPEPELTQISKRSNGHIDHIAFDVENIDETFQILKTSGYNIVEDEPVFLDFWMKGCRYFNVLGPGGERIEFNQIL